MPARLTPRLRPLTVALGAYEIWRRLPHEHRRQLLSSAGRHGPRIALSLVRRARRAP